MFRHSEHWIALMPRRAGPAWPSVCFLQCGHFDIIYITSSSSRLPSVLLLFGKAEPYPPLRRFSIFLEPGVCHPSHRPLSVCSPSVGLNTPPTVSMVIRGPVRLIYPRELKRWRGVWTDIFRWCENPTSAHRTVGASCASDGRTPYAGTLAIAHVKIGMVSRLYIHSLSS